MNAVLIILGSGSAAPAGECPAAYEIVTSAALPVLPERVRPFFERNARDIRLSATAGLAPGSPGHLASAESWHYLIMDIAAGAGDSAERHASAAAFPRGRQAADALCRTHSDGKCGELPWILADRVDVLSRAFKAADAPAVVREAGVLLHFVTDAALPCNTTAHHGLTGNGRRGEAGNEKTSGRQRESDRHFCGRWQCGLIDHVHERLEYEIRIWPGRFSYVGDPLDAVFELLTGSHRQLNALADFDRQVAREFASADSPALDRGDNAHNVRLASLCASVLKSRIEAAALLGANLIGTAWKIGGSPTLSTPPTPGPPPVAAEGRPIAPTQERLVGSRGSNVFHRESCPHVARINTENRVEFHTVDDAQKAGRRPCKTCAPDEQGR